MPSGETTPSLVADIEGTMFDLLWQLPLVEEELCMFHLQPLYFTKGHDLRTLMKIIIAFTGYVQCISPNL